MFAGYLDVVSFIDGKNMNRKSIVGAMVVMAVASASLWGAEIKSGIEVGVSVGTYSTTKCGGIDDGVKEGMSLCYT